MTILTEAADRLELSHLIPYDSLDRWKCELCGFIGKTSGKFTHSDACLITRLRAAASSQPMPDEFLTAMRKVLDRWAVFEAGQLDTLMAEISAAYSKGGE